MAYWSRGKQDVDGEDVDSDAVMVMAKMLIISCICGVCRSLGGPYWPIRAGAAGHGNYLKAYSHITH